MKFRVALVQFAPRLGDVDANLKRVLELIDQAKAQHVDLAIFPELGLTGYYLKDLVPNVSARALPDDPHLGPLLSASRDLDIVVGFSEVGARYTYYIAAAYLSDGRAVHVHRKVYLPTYRLFDDARFFARGDSFRAFDTRLGRMGLMICEDAWHISTPYVLWMDGADFLIDIAASPGYGISDLSTDSSSDPLASATSVNAFLRSYADLLTAFVFYCNRVGGEDGISFWGGSRVHSPEGELLATAPQFEEALVVADIDTDALRRARLKLPVLRDEELGLVRRELRRIGRRQAES